MRWSHFVFLEAETLSVHRMGRRESAQRTTLSSHPQVVIAKKEQLGVS